MTEELRSQIARLEAERDQLQESLNVAYGQMSEITSRVLAMSEAATSLVETHDVPSAAVAILDVAARSVLARTGCIFLSLGEGAFELVASTGLDEAQQEELSAHLPDLALCHLAENEGKTLDVTDAEATESFTEWKAEFLAEQPDADPAPRLDLFVPLLLGERTVAILALGARPGGQRYEESDRLFLEHVGDQGALAIDRALLFQQNQNRIEDLDALLRVSRELASTLDLDHVLITAVNLSGAIVDRERAVIALFDGGRLRIRAVNDHSRVDSNTSEVLGLDRLLEWLGYRKPESLIARLSEVEADPNHEGRDVLLEHFKGEMRALYAIGLRDDQGPVGVLLLESFNDGAFAVASDREALGVMSGQLAVAIRNAELYRQLPMVGALAPLAARRRRWERMAPGRRRLILLGLGVGLVLVGAVPFPAAIGGDGRVLPGSEMAVRTTIDGIVRQVDVRSGQYVIAGQRLAAFEPDGLSPRMAVLRAEADRALGAAAAAESRLDAYGRREAELDREVALARLTAAQRDAGRSQLTAPQAGYVLTPDLAEQEGMKLAAGEVFCQVSPLDTLRVEVGIGESEVGRIRPGQPLRMKVLGFPDRQFRGRVTEVSWQGESTQPGRPAVFKVLGWVANPGPTLRSGMTGRARIDVAPDTLLARWGRGLWRWIRLGFWM